MTHADTRKTFVDKCFKDKKGRVVIAQWPNAPLTIWATTEVLGMVWHHGIPHTVFQVIAQGALLVWAVLELVLGVNYFRKLLGFVVLVGMLTMLLLDLRVARGLHM